MIPFRMYGRIVQIYRYAVAYEVEMPGLDGERVTESRTDYCNTPEEAEAVSKRLNGVITKLDSSAYEWLDGIEVADVPDTYAEAVRIYEMEREAYEAELAKPTPEETVAALENQVTDLQLALCDFYESVVEVSN